MEGSFRDIFYINSSSTVAKGDHIRLFYSGEESLDWGYAYQRILNANVILEGIEKVKPTISDQQDWNSVKGAALFFRAFDFFNLAQEYCVAYNSSSANRDLGLPLRLEYDVDIKVKRSNLQQTYDRIITDKKMPLIF